MEALLAAALDAARGPGVQYADARVLAPQRYEHLAVRDGEASALTESMRSGIGVRVRTRTAWGFAAVGSLEPARAREAAKLAVRTAVAAGRTTRETLVVAPAPVVPHGAYASDVRIDPFEVPLEEKVALLVAAEKALHVDPSVKSGHASFQAWREDKWFASTDGSQYRSTITHVGAGVNATAVASGEVQRRSAPSSFGGDYRQAGWEFVQGLHLDAIAPTVGREAVQQLSAPACPTGSMTIVLGSDQLALQVHESVGHATELDRILAMEAGFAGTSWVGASDVGSLRYGSVGMNVVADATEPGGLGTFGWDDEGVAARRTPIVTEGRLVGVLSSRETAPRVGLGASGATCRADGFDRAPLIRMTNVDLLPGDRTMDELLEGVDDGVYFETNRSWSIDDKRLNFQFGTEIGRRIVEGELAGPVRNPIYAGSTPQFWASMDAVGNAGTWHLWGVPNCGKGQPMGAARVGHGAPAARFRNVQVRGG